MAPLALSYGRVPLQNYTLVVRPGELDVLAALASRIFANQGFSVTLTAPLAVRVLGITFHTTVSRDFDFAPHTTEPNNPAFRWKAIDLATNTRDSATIDATVMIQSALPWAHIHVPHTVELEVLVGDARVVTVLPQADLTTAGSVWVIQNGWNTLATTATGACQLPQPARGSPCAQWHAPTPTPPARCSTILWPIARWSASRAAWSRAPHCQFLFARPLQFVHARHAARRRSLLGAKGEDVLSRPLAHLLC